MGIVPSVRGTSNWTLEREGESGAVSNSMKAKNPEKTVDDCGGEGKTHRQGRDCAQTGLGGIEED